MKTRSLSYTHAQINSSLIKYFNDYTSIIYTHTSIYIHQLQYNSISHLHFELLKYARFTYLHLSKYCIRANRKVLLNIL